MTRPRRLTGALLAGALTLTGATSAIVGPAGALARPVPQVAAGGAHSQVVPQCDACPN